MIIFYISLSLHVCGLLLCKDITYLRVSVTDVMCHVTNHYEDAACEYFKYYKMDTGNLNSNNK